MFMRNNFEILKRLAASEVDLLPGVTLGLLDYRDIYTDSDGGPWIADGGYLHIGWPGKDLASLTLSVSHRLSSMQEIQRLWQRSLGLTDSKALTLAWAGVLVLEELCLYSAMRRQEFLTVLRSLLGFEAFLTEYGAAIL